MITAPTVPNLQVENFKIGDRRQAVIKDNSRNQKMELFATELAAMCAELDIEFQFVADTRTDITNKSGQVAADRQAVTLAKQSVDASKAHIDQREAVIDTTADEVSQNAQQVASDKQAVAQDKQTATQAASAASGSAGDALQAKNDAEALYGDLDAVNTAKTQSQQAAQTATQQAGLADTARQGAEQALADALAALQQAEGNVDDAIAALVDSSPDALNTLNELAAALGDDPNFATTMTNALADKLSKSGGVLTGKTSIEKASIDTAEFELRGGRTGAGGAITRITLSNNQDNAQGFIDTWLRDSSGIDLELSGFRKLTTAMAVDFVNGMSVRSPGTGFTNIDMYSGRTGAANIGGIRFWNGNGAKAGELLFTADGKIFGANGGVLYADRLGGQLPATTDAADTIAQRDNAGDIRARLFRSTYSPTNSDIAAFYTTRTIGGDFIRPSTPEQVRDALGANPTTISGATTNNVSGANHTHNVSTTASRDSSNTALLLNAKGMYDHKRSGDHDDRYYTKGEFDSALAGAMPSDFNTKGSYAVLRIAAVDDTLPGDTRVGSNLTVVRPDGQSGYTNDQGIPYSVTGTWKLMSGRCTSISSGNNETRTGIWLKL